MKSSKYELSFPSLSLAHRVDVRHDVLVLRNHVNQEVEHLHVGYRRADVLFLLIPR